MEQFPSRNLKYRIEDYDPKRLLDTIKMYLEYNFGQLADNHDIFITINITAITRFILEHLGLSSRDDYDLQNSSLIDPTSKIIAAEYKTRGLNLQVFNAIRSELIRLACEGQIRIYLNLGDDKYPSLLPYSTNDFETKPDMMLSLYEMITPESLDSICISYNKVS
jgi:hypothetical protein